MLIYHPAYLQTACEICSFLRGLWNCTVVGKSMETVDLLFPTWPAAIMASSKGQLICIERHLHT
jgi:hypothetical protein